MLTKVDGVERTAMFIKDNFGMDAALAYGRKECILVIETLMHLQFSYPGDSSAGGEEAKEALLTDLRTKSRNLRLAASHIGKGSASNDVRIGLKFLEQYNFSSTASKIKKISDEETQRELISETLLFIEQKLLARITEVEGMSASEFASQSSGRIQIEPMLVGTVPNLVKIKSNLNPEPTVFDSYLNRTAAVSEYIKPGDAGEQAGFIAWDGIYSAGNNKIKNADVIKYGLGMMVFTAQTDNQTTCDEPQQPAPHKAPVESTGTTTIIKNYRTKEGTQLTDDGCFVTQNVSSDITIESEGKYQVVGWATSSSTSTIPSTTWPVPSALRSGTTSSTIKLDSTEKCLYVLLEKIEDPPPEEPQDYNYKLTQSSITRRVNFTTPDHRLSMPHIENHNFKWIIPAHQTSCPGHTFTDACHGQHIGPHTEDCPEACSSTCTKAHTHNTEGCQDPHYYDCGTRCTTQTAYCSGWQWHEQNLKLSINNTHQSNHPDILADKQGWNAEVKNGHSLKHYYLNDASFTRDSTASQSYEESNWDYICILMRGKDKLTIAHWQNAGQGNGLSNQANSNLQAVSSSGFAVSNQDSGTRKTQDYMETFSTYFSTEESEGVDNRTYYKSTIDATVDAPDTPKGSTLCGINERKAYISNPLSINNIKVRIK